MRNLSFLSEDPSSLSFSLFQSEYVLMDSICCVVETHHLFHPKLRLTFHRATLNSAQINRYMIYESKYCGTNTYCPASLRTGGLKSYQAESKTGKLIDVSFPVPHPII